MLELTLLQLRTSLNTALIIQQQYKALHKSPIRIKVLGDVLHYHFYKQLLKRGSELIPLQFWDG